MSKEPGEYRDDIGSGSYFHGLCAPNKPNAFFVHNEIGGVIERCDAIHYNTRKVAVIKIMKKEGETDGY